MAKKKGGIGPGQVSKPGKVGNAKPLHRYGKRSVK
jgi:hypothetical protein